MEPLDIMTVKKQSDYFEKDLVSKSLFFSFSLYIRMFLKLISGIFIAKFLGPSLFGLKNAYDLALGYESYSNLGTFSALNRQAPLYRGQQNIDKANIAISTVYTISLTYASIAAVIIIVVSQIMRYQGYEQRYIDFAFFFGIMILTGRMISFLQTKLKIDQRFYVLSINQMLYGFTAAIFGVMLVFYFRFRGLLISLLIADSICLCYLFLNEKKLPEVKISLKHYWALLKIGFPMMILFVLLMLLSSVDRTLILAMISEKALGYYGIATVATGVIATIPQAIHNVTIAPIMEKLGRNKNSQSIKNYLNDPMLLLAYLLPILICCLYFSIHLPINYYLYKYIPSIPVVKILLIGAYFEAVATPSLSIALALNKQIRLIIIVLPIVGLNFGLNYMFIKTGWGLNGVAAGTSISFFVYFCVIQYFAQLQFKVSFQVFLKRLFIIFVPFGYSLIIIFLINTFIEIEIKGILSDIFSTILRIVTFIIFYSILIYNMRKQFGSVMLNSKIVSLLEKIRFRIWREKLC